MVFRSTQTPRTPRRKPHEASGTTPIPCKIWTLTRRKKYLTPSHSDTVAFLSISVEGVGLTVSPDMFSCGHIDMAERIEYDIPVHCHAVRWCVIIARSQDVTPYMDQSNYS